MLGSVLSSVMNYMVLNVQLF